MSDPTNSQPSTVATKPRQGDLPAGTTAVVAAPRELSPDDLPHMKPEQVVRSFLEYAANLHASDVFLLSEQRFLVFALRRLGIVERFGVVPHDVGRACINFVKNNAGLDISEHRHPMDGRWLDRFGSAELDLRINTMPTVFGEDVTLRLWDRRSKFLTLDRLGLFPADLEKVKTMLASPSGLLLATGPTESGKTTTLYSCLMHLNDGTCKINTLEDPVEYTIDGVRQSQVHSKIGLDFPELLRAVLRQAPDIVMIGEIRDSETAVTAVRAANAGHLVLATLHAPVAAGAVQGLLVYGAAPYFLSNCLLGVISQRLVRTLCPACRVRDTAVHEGFSLDLVRDLLPTGSEPTAYSAGQCEACRRKGFVARTALFEVMTMNHELRRKIAAASSIDEIQATAVRHDMVEFRRSALRAIAQGTTSVDEVLRNLPAEHLGLET